MNPDQLSRLEDVTRRYARYRPCGAGIGVLWGGALLGLLGGLVARWALSAYAAHAAQALRDDGLWHFLRSSRMAPPGWLAAAGFVTPFLAWLGLAAIQRAVDRSYGAVEGMETSRLPQWAAAKLVACVALLFIALQAWDSAAALAGWGTLGILAITAWTLVWGRASRDSLTQKVMLGLSIPPFFLLAATLEGNTNMASQMLVTFGVYFAVMGVMLVQGLLRFRGFRKVSRELADLQPVQPSRQGNE
jgi:hypothetical protein